jgi:hypothetical protein
MVLGSTLLQCPKTDCAGSKQHAWQCPGSPLCALQASPDATAACHVGPSGRMCCWQRRAVQHVGGCWQLVVTWRITLAAGSCCGRQDMHQLVLRRMEHGSAAERQAA